MYLTYLVRSEESVVITLDHVLGLLEELVVLIHQEIDGIVDLAADS